MEAGRQGLFRNAREAVPVEAPVLEGEAVEVFDARVEVPVVVVVETDRPLHHGP